MMKLQNDNVSSKISPTMFSSSSIRLIVSGFHRPQTLVSPANPKVLHFNSTLSRIGSSFRAMSSVENPTGSGNRASRMKEKLEKELEPVELVIEDVSYQHAGHAGIKGRTDGETHFNVKIVSEGFEGLNLVKRHRLVYDLLKEELDSGLHALSIVSKTPSEINR